MLRIYKDKFVIYNMQFFFCHDRYSRHGLEIKFRKTSLYDENTITKSESSVLLKALKVSFLLACTTFVPLYSFPLFIISSFLLSIFFISSLLSVFFYAFFFFSFHFSYILFSFLLFSFYPICSFLYSNFLLSFSSLFLLSSILHFPLSSSQQTTMLYTVVLWRMPSEGLCKAECDSEQHKSCVSVSPVQFRCLLSKPHFHFASFQRFNRWFWERCSELGNLHTNWRVP